MTANFALEAKFIAEGMINGDIDAYNGSYKIGELSKKLKSPRCLFGFEFHYDNQNLHYSPKYLVLLAKKYVSSFNCKISAEYPEELKPNDKVKHMEYRDKMPSYYFDLILIPYIDSRKTDNDSIIKVADFLVATHEKFDKLTDSTINSPIETLFIILDGVIHSEQGHHQIFLQGLLVNTITGAIQDNVYENKASSIAPWVKWSVAVTLDISWIGAQLVFINNWKNVSSTREFKCQPDYYVDSYFPIREYAHRHGYEQPSDEFIDSAFAHLCQIGLLDVSMGKRHLFTVHKLMSLQLAGYNFYKSTHVFLNHLSSKTNVHAI